MNGGPTASILGVPARYCNQWSQKGRANRRNPEGSQARPGVARPARPCGGDERSEIAMSEEMAGQGRRNRELRIRYRSPKLKHEQMSEAGWEPDIRMKTMYLADLRTT